MVEIERYESGKIKLERHLDENNKLHSLYGPALISYYEDGDIEDKCYFIHGVEKSTKEFFSHIV